MEDDGPSLALVDSKLDWIVKRKHTFVVWHDSTGNAQCLGQLSSHNRKSRFTISIGHDVQKGQLLIMLHLPISLRASSKTKPRDMFLVVPTEPLSIADAASAFPALSSDNVSKTLVDQLKDVPFAESNRLLHIPFALSQPSNVVMPKENYPSNVKGTPLKLLSNLKSLSESLSFDAYINFNSYAQRGLQQICKTLDGFTTPAIDLDRMYGRGGGLNLWHCQGLHKDRQKAGKAPDVLSDASPPPPYEPATCLPLPQPQSSRQSSPALRDPSPALLVARSDSGDPPCALTLDDLSFIAESPRLIPTLLDREEERYSGPATPAYEQHLPDSPVFQPTRKRKARSSFIVDERQATHGLASCHDSVNHSDLQRNALHASSHPRDFSVQSQTPGSLLMEIIHWLFTAWKMCPDAHVLLRAELLAFGAAAGRGDTNAFDYARTICSSRLALRVAEATVFSNKVISQVDTTPAQVSPDSEEVMMHVVGWVNAVERGADLLILDDLVLLATKLRALADLRHDLKQREANIGAHQDASADTDGDVRLEDAERSLILQKAKCIAIACFHFGHKYVV
ncbi:hypothetical protein BDV97DRAFT_350143 [Delphinella strobiligena]|nr:hypothetical protein BDV97DRAFT_350143 [Delphinella strobiligena]